MKKWISILEDDPAIMDIYRILLDGEGYQVNSFENVASFMASTAKADLYLLDIRLPDGNGLEVCEKLKNDPRYAAIPVLLLSAHADRPSIMESCRADAFMEKPFDIYELLNCIAALLP